MTEEDERDYAKFLEGIEFFLKLDVQQHMEHIKQHYCESQPTMDPFEIIPIGPNMTTLLDMTVGRLATQNVSVTFLPVIC